MGQSIQTSKFGTLDTSGRIPVYLLAASAQDADNPALNLGLSFTVNGKNYTFVPEDRVSTGSASGNEGRIYPGFLNPQLLSNLKNTSEYVDIAGTQFGNFDIGNFISQSMGGSTKGYLATQENIQPIVDAGVTFYDPSIMGKVTGIGSANGAPAYVMPNGNSYLTPDGRIATTTRTLVGWRESGGLGGLGSFLASIDPSSALSQAATQLFQPVEQTVSQNLAQLDKDLSLSQNAPTLAAIALSVAAPGVGSAIGQQMIAAGLIPATTSAAVATAIGTGVANAALQVAQGKSAEDALKGAVVSGVAGFAGGQVGDYLVGDAGAVKNFVSSTAANMVAGKDPETAAKNALVQTGIQGAADAISTAQAEKYLESLPIPEHLDVGPAPTSADTIATFPETNPANIQGSPTEVDAVGIGGGAGVFNTNQEIGYKPNIYNPIGDISKNVTVYPTGAYEGPDTEYVPSPISPANQVDTTLSNIIYGPTTGTTEGITATLPITTVTGTEPIDYAITPNVTVNDVVKDIVIENLNTNLQNGTLTADQVDTALATLTGDYTLSGTTEGIKATLPDTIVSGTEPIDYTLKTVTDETGIQAKPDTTTNLVQSTGLHTYTYDDGSTITVDENGDIVDYTEATDTPYKGAVETPSSPLTKEQIEGLIKLGLGIYGTSKVSQTVRDAISSGNETTTQTGFPYIPSDISDWARPVYTKTWQAPIDLNSIFTTDNLLGGTQWAGLQGDQFSNIPQVSMSDFIANIQNGKV